jgi:hypothetical protein
MEDIATNPAPDVATTPPPEVELEEPIVGDDPDLEPNPEGDEPAEETTEVDYEGKKYVLPKELKDALLRQADYTKKTQETAETRKSLETDRESLGQQRKALEDHIVDVGRLMSVDERLAHYDKIDWKAWSAQAPQDAQSAWFEKEQLRQNRDALAGKLHQEWQTKSEAQQRESAKQIADGQAVLAREIPNWSPQLANELAQYGKSIGLSDKRLSGIVEPAEVKILHKARMYDQLVAKQRAATGQPAVQAQPVSQVGARRSPASNEPKDSDSADVWMKKRNAQLAKRNGAQR